MYRICVCVCMQTYIFKWAAYSVLSWGETGSACFVSWARLWVQEVGRAACGGDLHRDIHTFFSILAFFFLLLTAPCHAYPLRMLNYICKHGKTEFQGPRFPPPLCMGESSGSRRSWGSSGSSGEMKLFVSLLSPSDGGIQLRARHNCLSSMPLWGTQSTTCTRSYYLEQEPPFAYAQRATAMLFTCLVYSNLRIKGTPNITLHEIFALLGQN